MDPLTTISTRSTPQTERAAREQVENSAGGYVFSITPREQLLRFLTLGTDAPTYYASAADLSRDNAALVIRLAETEHQMLVDTIVEVSVAGRAPKQNPTLFALAIACSIGTEAEKRYALDRVSSVARTGTMLFQFIGYAQQFRGWGRGFARAVGDWYLARPVDSLAYQTVKYRQRNGWTHRDVLRKSHPTTSDERRNSLLRWITKGETDGPLPIVVEGYLKAQEQGADIPALIQAHSLPWEALPTEALAKAETWEALIASGTLPHGALIRNLPRLTNLGLLPQMGGMTNDIIERLTSTESLRRARIHPVNLLNAQRTYASGQGFRGKGSWTPTPKVVDALDAAFYSSFGFVEPAGKRTMVALDLSASMTWVNAGQTALTPRDASAALALVTMATEPDVLPVGFTSGGGYGYRSAAVSPLTISPRQRLDDVIKTIQSMPAGATDCSLPMLSALERKVEIDTFVVYTDNETWAGQMHPFQALRQYRERMGIDAKLIVVGMTATPFSIADPSDSGMLDIAGFDSAVPGLISDFSRGA